jgi:hypothetical protein
MNPPCLIPANPDISGIGVRAAIYAQNLLSFVPAFYALVDGRVDGKELETIEAQSTTILVTAFAILISTIVQALSPYGLSDFHASVILNLSWMNNTNTFIYLILYIHHRTGLTGDSRVAPEWAAWWHHIRQGLFVKRNWLPRVVIRACPRYQGLSYLLRTCTWMMSRSAVTSLVPTSQGQSLVMVRKQSRSCSTSIDVSS